MSGPVSGIDHVQVAAPAGCEPEASRFYGDLLGLEEIPKPAGVVGSGGSWFRCGAQELHVGVADPFVPAVKAHPGLKVVPGALDALAARLQDAGAEVQWDTRIPERRRFYVRDPWGNRLELTA